MAGEHLETKAERFKTVAGRRVQRLLDSMDNLSNCANKRNYEYSEEDVKKMFKVINDHYMLLKAAFTANSKTGKKTFKF